MDMMDKLKILADAAKYDVACTSSGSNRAAKRGELGHNVACGICHSFTADGRCISLLKILLTNQCIYDCQYCGNRRSTDIPRAEFTPDEVAELTIRFYQRNYIEGLFLSSAIVKNPDHTMELLINALKIVREKYRFNGYIHVKTIPGADDALVRQAALLADRLSVNIELPSHESLKVLAPDKTKQNIIAPMKIIREGIAQAKNELALYRHAKNEPSFAPAGQSTQLIVGATPESDSKIVSLAEGLYGKFKLKRVFYSAYIPAGGKNLPTADPPLLREHRLYQADWLLRFYNYTASELFSNPDENLSLEMDPKCHWAVNNLHQFPVEINKADYLTLLRVPGIGQVSAQRIVAARRVGKIDFDGLKKMRVVLRRAKFFITCDGKTFDKLPLYPETIAPRLRDNSQIAGYQQLSLSWQ
ncbi:MAG: putative DNA modification/repair radical SAM protein [Defluviitaleaceae bacterium]|nr:putative DNA modification/repair radical SAM protein [Defluviitaleaceae bacterium]MCL2263545.1 putative DNA modification/repair radical SAM protein [Defluviitaleaceae bacterium]